MTNAAFDTVATLSVWYKSVMCRVALSNVINDVPYFWVVQLIRNSKKCCIPVENTKSERNNIHNDQK